VIDGDSFAHRSYHALPKTIRRSDGRAAGAILGFANLVLRLYVDERPRAVIVGWDSLGMPTKRHEMFPAYQSGREFDDDLIEQLNVLPELVAAFGFANAKAAGYEADDFLAAAVAFEERAGGSALVASGDRDSFQVASPRTTILYRRGAGRYRALGRKRSGNDMALIQAKYRTSSRSAETLLTNCLGLPGSDQNAPLSWCNGTGRLIGSLRPVSFKLKLRCSDFIGSSRRWMRKRRCRCSLIKSRDGAQHRTSRAIGG
jgi:5'-3' exonuclease